MIVQIYEIQKPLDAERCLDLGVDHIGSVLLTSDNWRSADLKKVTALAAQAGAKSSLLPLFEDLDVILKVLDYYNPGLIHLCQAVTDDKGEKSDLKDFIALQESIRKNFPKTGIMRSIPVPASGGFQGFPTLDLARELESVSDYFLVDTWLGREPVEGYIGITGKKADWDIAKALVFQSTIPVILAGGLSPDNVYEGLMKVMPAGADSCTLTNRVKASGLPERFNKDFKKLEDFIREIRRAEADIQRKRACLLERLERLKADLREREAAMPAHSIRPHQLIELEELEEKIEETENRLKKIPG